jgi:hypothetical protein
LLFLQLHVDVQVYHQQPPVPTPQSSPLLNAQLHNGTIGHFGCGRLFSHVFAEFEFDPRHLEPSHVGEAHPVKLAEILLSKLFAAAAWDFASRSLKAELFFLRSHFLFSSTPSTLGKSSPLVHQLRGAAIGLNVTAWVQILPSFDL